MESEEADQPRPAPVDLDDPQAFYALLHGYSMVPTGIGPADFCLVSPCAKLEPGQRIWLRDRKGREGLRWLIRMTATAYEVAAWQPPKPNGHLDLAAERWERKDVNDRGAVLAVYRGWVVPSDPVRRLPDWHPGRLTGLWRALFDEQTELQAAVAEHLEETTASFNRRIQGWLEQGSVQRSDMQDLLQQVENVKQLAQLLSRRSGSVPQRVQSAERTVGRPDSTRAGEQRAVTEPALRERERRLHPAGRLRRPRRPALPLTSHHRLDADDPHEQQPPGDGRRPSAQPAARVVTAARPPPAG